MSVTRAVSVWLVCGLLVGTFAVVLANRPTMSRTERTQVRVATVRLLEADAAVGRLPDELAARREVLISQSGARRTALGHIWVSDRVDASAAEWTHGIAAVADDADYRAYAENRLRVTHWESMRTAKGGVDAIFTGHMEYRGTQGHGWSQEPLSRYHVVLRKSGGAWRLADVDEDPLVAP